MAGILRALKPGGRLLFAENIRGTSCIVPPVRP